MDKVEINIKPVIVVNTVIKVLFPIRVTTVVKLFDRLIRVIKRVK